LVLPIRSPIKGSLEWMCVHGVHLYKFRLLFWGFIVLWLLNRYFLVQH
jgi:hypothetical protein